MSVHFIPYTSWLPYSSKMSTFWPKSFVSNSTLVFSPGFSSTHFSPSRKLILVVVISSVLLRPRCHARLLYKVLCEFDYTLINCSVIFIGCAWQSVC